MNRNSFDPDDPITKGMVDSLVESAYKRGWKDAIAAVRDRLYEEPMPSSSPPKPIVIQTKI